MRTLPEQGKDISDRHHVFELFWEARMVPVDDEGNYVAALLAWRKRRAFGFFSRLRQPGMGSDPIDSIFPGDKFSKVVHGTIRPYYFHAPNVAFAHRQ